jgi:predicted anti-sigma-YlaC factor YlaD
MKPQPCEQYREKIEQYVCNELDSSQSRLFLEHIGQCPACREYLENLNRQEQKISAWVDSLNPMVETGQSETIARFRQMQAQMPQITKTPRRFLWLCYAAAACILITISFLVGRLSSPAIDTAKLQQELAASLRPQIENQVTASVVQSLRKEVVGQYAKMQDNIAGQISTELKAYAEQTVVRNDIQTYRLLAELIDAIKTSQSQNQQWVLSAMDTLEKCRLKDQTKMRSEFADFAVYTGNELTRTQEQLKMLSSDAKRN